ncbi:phosphotransferase [Falsibacillus albus]|uniref:Homoserine kinase n=1 Tax=Falsibacillus albus TaxID=2478915 RepID=A0A3L7JZW2_9BACI|nr:phosphotransferase [Falsibacillus albus]RLQ96306.1 homoserine kinase [Falsibacillus albus]
MNQLLSNEMILADLLKTCKVNWGWNVVEATPINRGWLNLKWKIKTDNETVLLKQYNKNRLLKYNLKELSFSFSQQMRLRDAGFTCPRFKSMNGRIFQESQQGERFVAMEFCNGSLRVPGSLNEHEMFDLGKTTGRMHRLLNEHFPIQKIQPAFIPPTREERIAHWENVRKQVIQKCKPELTPYIEQQIIQTGQLDLDLLNIGDTGWAHRDLWVDNLLFSHNQVSAVLDFDRLKFDHLPLDVGRAVISGAMTDDGLNISCANAFMKGYREERIVGEGYLTSALKLLWYMESIWWITSDMDKHTVPPARFAHEMIWLGENLARLDEMLEGI